jgi:GAF domain-containing protein
MLFVVQRGGLQALGAFGACADGRQLATATHGMVLRNVGNTALAEAMTEGRARIVDYSPRALPEELMAVIDRPESGQVALFPVLGSRRVIALIYADHGRHDRTIDDVEIMEIATAQVGLAFENELLRRQIDRR